MSAFRQPDGHDPRRDPPPLGMSPRAFTRFDHWMDYQLGKLVKRWSGWAAPNALRAAASARRGLRRPTPRD